MAQALHALAQSIVRELSQQRRRIVFAESCTGGLVSATLARVPGVSEYLCGSAVVYRLDTKSKWLGVPESILIDPGPVSDQVARSMAMGVLTRTPEADIAVSITGHLGPNAPEGQDGLVFVGLAERHGNCESHEHRLPCYPGLRPLGPYPGETERELRQWNAVDLVLRILASHLDVELKDV